MFDGRVSGTLGSREEHRGYEQEFGPTGTLRLRKGSRDLGCFVFFGTNFFDSVDCCQVSHNTRFSYM